MSDPTQRTERLPPDGFGLSRAAELLRGGELVSFPTETVYGLGADACNDTAVARIYQAKGRPSFNPLIVHVADTESAARYVRLGPVAQKLAKAFWPGPLTMVLPRRADAGISQLVSAGLPSLAVRVPDAPLAQALLRRADLPVAAPSANASGRISPTLPDHVLGDLEGRIAAVLMGGRCAVGLESTILDLTEDTPKLLRPGGLGLEAIEHVLGQQVAQVRGAGQAPIAPGMLSSHYAPRGRVVLEQAARPEGALWLGFGPDCAGADLNLSPSGDLLEAAATLFEALHDLDARAGEQGQIAVAPIPERGLGRAINDRLRRAAAPR